MKKILIADDYEGIRTTTERIIRIMGYTEGNGYAVLVCSSGEEAEKAYFSEKPVRLAILDDKMPPGKTGLQLARIMKEDDPEVKTFLITANEIPKKAMEGIIDHYFQKPASIFDMEPLLKAYLG